MYSSDSDLSALSAEARLGLRMHATDVGVERRPVDPELYLRRRVLIDRKIQPTEPKIQMWHKPYQHIGDHQCIMCMKYECVDQNNA